MTGLTSFIRREISRHGSIPFARFMELALYHPELGYYRRPADPFGIHGDFYTAEQLPVFGQLLAIYVRSLSAAFRPGEPFDVLELGAGRGELRHALHSWNFRAHDFAGDTLPDPFSGLVIANEFFDASPVHLLRRLRNGWRQLGVTWSADSFALCGTRHPTALGAYAEKYAEKYGALIPVGGMLEVNLAMAHWLTRVSEIMRKGRLLVIDYGYSTPELTRFPAGTLMSYRKHAATPDILNSPGTRDITAHVNFSQLRDEAASCGFTLVRESSLQAWALCLCETREWKNLWETADTRWRLQWKQLVYGMGETFRVLEWEKALAK